MISPLHASQETAPSSTVGQLSRLKLLPRPRPRPPLPPPSPPPLPRAPPCPAHCSGTRWNRCRVLVAGFSPMNKFPPEKVWPFFFPDHHDCRPTTLVDWHSNKKALEAHKRAVSFNRGRGRRTTLVFFSQKERAATLCFRNSRYTGQQGVP